MNGGGKQREIKKVPDPKLALVSHKIKRFDTLRFQLVGAVMERVNELE